MADGTGVLTAALVPLSIEGINNIPKKNGKGEIIRYYYRDTKTKKMLGSSDDHGQVLLNFLKLRSADQTNPNAVAPYVTPNKDTIGTLVGKFYKSEMFLDEENSDRHRGEQRRYLERLRSLPFYTDVDSFEAGKPSGKWGDRQYKLVRKIEVQVLRRQLREGSGKVASNRAITTYHRLYEYAQLESEGLANPFAKPGRYKEKPRTTIWEIADLHTFLSSEHQQGLGGNPKALAAGSQKQRTVTKHLPWQMYYAVAFCYYTCIRGCDLLKLRTSNLKTHEEGYRYLDFVQDKTDVRVQMRLPATLAALIEDHPDIEIDDALLIPPPSDKDKEWKERSFKKRFDAWLAHSDLKGKKTFHDLRRTGIVELGKLNLQPQIIAAISGHSISYCVKILETYLPKSLVMANVGIDARDAAETQARKAGKILAFDVPARLPAPRVQAA